MSVIEVIKRRRSIRLWKHDLVPMKIIMQLIDAGRWAPSSCNRQTWKFIVITDNNLRRFVGNIPSGARPFFSKAPTLILVLIDMRAYRLPIEKYAPAQDAAAAIQNMLLAAHSLGLGACWASWTSTRKKEKILYELLNIPFYYEPFGLVAVGFPDETPIPPARRDIDEIMVLNRFVDRVA